MTANIQLMRRLLLLTSMVALLMAMATSCASSGHDALLKIQVPASENNEEATAAPAKTLASAPDLDQRDEVDNQLALIEQLREEREELRAALAKQNKKLAMQSEMSARDSSIETQLEGDNSRLKKMLENSQERERELQRQLLLAKLESVRHEKAKVREKIRNIGAGDND